MLSSVLTAQGAMQALVKAMPARLTHGFEVAGGILPAVGFGLLLRVMFKAQYIPYLIAGFLFVCYIGQQPVAGCRTGRRLCGV